MPRYLRIVDNYLRDRVLFDGTREGQGKMAVTAGAAQVSVLGPDLWNASYNSLLRMEMQDDSCLAG